MGYDFKCRVMTHPGAGTPHLAGLIASNPGLDVGVWESAPGRGAGHNCDRNFRDWFLAEQPDGERFLMLEPDVRVTADLRPFFPDEGNDIEAANYFPEVRVNRPNLFETMIRWMPSEMQDVSCVMSPAIYMFSRRALEYLARPEFREVFEGPGFSELRTPTLLAHGGFKCAANPRLTHVKCWSSLLPDTPDPGILHPAKN